MRKARAVSESGFYHVILRGDGKRQIFEDDADRRAFLSLVECCLVARGVDVVAWCLMSNHVHLVVCDTEESLSEAVGSLAMRYARRFNSRTGHVGHVFQERFRSSPIESDAYLLEAVRYVHNNPEKSGICRAEEYTWSSYSEYVAGSKICDTEVILDMLGGVEGFKEFRSDGGPAYLQVLRSCEDSRRRDGGSGEVRARRRLRLRREGAPEGREKRETSRSSRMRALGPSNRAAYGDWGQDHHASDNVTHNFAVTQKGAGDPKGGRILLGHPDVPKVSCPLLGRLPPFGSPRNYGLRCRSRDGLGPNPRKPLDLTDREPAFAKSAKFLVSRALRERPHVVNGDVSEHGLRHFPHLVVGNPRMT